MWYIMYLVSIIILIINKVMYTVYNNLYTYNIKELQQRNLSNMRHAISLLLKLFTDNDNSHVYKF